MNERKFLIRNVKKARDLINGKLKITPKSKSGDLVTNFDIAIEKFLIKKIKRIYPDFDIISEEFNGDKQLSKNCFVIDPIDGTNNFARKIPIWGMQIACIKNGETVASVIYLPTFEELYSADKTGAYLNDEKIHVNQQDEKIGVYTIEKSIPEVFEIQSKNPNCRLFGSAAFTLAMVACGKMSAAMFKDTIHPWDIIPGEYLVQKAGGVSFVSNHIRVCANSTSWVNLLTKFEKSQPKNIPLKNEEIAENLSISENNKQTLDEPTEESETIDKESTNELEITMESEENFMTDNESEPSFFIEESETVLETFVVDTSETKEPEPLIIEEKEQPKAPVKVSRPTTLKPIIKKPSLTEARRRKIIM